MLCIDTFVYCFMFLCTVVLGTKWGRQQRYLANNFRKKVGSFILPAFTDNIDNTKDFYNVEESCKYLISKRNIYFMCSKLRVYHKVDLTERKIKISYFDGILVRVNKGDLNCAKLPQYEGYLGACRDTCKDVSTDVFYKIPSDLFKVVGSSNYYYILCDSESDYDKVLSKILRKAHKLK